MDEPHFFLLLLTSLMFINFLGFKSTEFLPGLSGWGWNFHLEKGPTLFRSLQHLPVRATGCVNLAHC